MEDIETQYAYFCKKFSGHDVKSNFSEGVQQYMYCVKPLFDKCYDKDLLERFLIEEDSVVVPFEYAFQDAVHYRMESFATKLIEETDTITLDPLPTQSFKCRNDTVLHFIIRRCSLDKLWVKVLCKLADALLTKNPKLNFTGTGDGFEKMTPIQLAVELDEHRIIPVLLKFAPDLVQQRAIHHTGSLLKFAIFNNLKTKSLSTIKALVEGGATMVSNPSPYEYACEHRCSKRVISYLKSKTPPESAKLYDSRFDILGDDGLSALHKVIIAGDLKKAKKYMKHGADSSVKTASGKTSYELAQETISFLK